VRDWSRPREAGSAEKQCVKIKGVGGFVLGGVMELAGEMIEIGRVDLIEF
jgi:hypothetical protein